MGEVGELREELKEAVKREGQKSLELARVQQDLLLAQKAQATLKAERDDLGKKVGALCWGGAETMVLACLQAYVYG